MTIAYQRNIQCIEIYNVLLYDRNARNNVVARVSEEHVVYFYFEVFCKHRRGAAVASFATSPDPSTPALSRRRHYIQAENKNISN